MQNALYPTDMSDEQWTLLQLILPPRRAAKRRGRPPAVLRRICNALLYFVRAGCAWRLLPRDFGPWKTIYHYFWLWTKQGCWKIIHDLLREAVRKAAGKRSQPTAAILDSQTVRSADQAGERGYDAAKQTKGIKLTPDRTSPPGWPPIAKRVRCGWRSSSGTGAGLASACWPSVGSLNEPSA